MTAPDTRTVDQHGMSVARLCRELDALSRRNEQLDGENRALRCLVDELRVIDRVLNADLDSAREQVASLQQRLDQARWRRGW